MTAQRTAASPMPQAVIDGMLRRAEVQSGPVRQLLMARAAQLQAEQGAGGAMPLPATPTAPMVAAAAPKPSQALAALTALVDRLGRGTQRLAAVNTFHGTWARLRTQQRLRQALVVVPQQAGPLHSAHLVHRALQTLHGLSPAYLEAVLSHMDTLLWLDAASGGGSAHSTHSTNGMNGQHSTPRAPGHAAAAVRGHKKKRPSRGQGAK